MYPKLVIDLKKLENNLNAVGEMTKVRGNCSLMIVTKALCADQEMVKMVAANDYVDFVADSRTKNLASIADIVRGEGKKTVLLRIPMHSEVAEVVKYVDLCFNSELSTIRLINEEAAKTGKVQDILLMIDLGDLREGIFFQNEELIFEAVEEILAMENINLYGIGVNLTCYGAIIPKYENLSKLVEIGEKLEKKYGIKLEMVSGGNSSSIYLVDKGELPDFCRLTSGYANTYGRLVEDKPCTTITNNMCTPSALRCIHYAQNRELTPREGARIQSFPDWYVFCGQKTHVTTQIGNAVPPLLAMAMARKIEEKLEQLED